MRAVFGPLPSLLTESPELLSLTGLAALAWLIAVLSFGLSVSLLMQVVISILALANLIMSRTAVHSLLRSYGQSWRAASGYAMALALVLVALVLVHAAQPPAFADAALYHAQFVQWLHFYPVVPGLGNLHGRLAFNSHTHLLTAFFSPAVFPGRWPAFQQTVNSFGFLLLTLYQVRRAAYHLHSNGRFWLGWFHLGSLLLLFMAMRPWISSPLPDATVAVLGLLVLGVLLETPRLSAAGCAWLLVMVATAITFKASSVALLLWPVACIVQQPVRYWLSGFSRLTGLAVLVLLPWVGRNIVLSGYAAYPVAGFIGPIIPSWAVPPTRLAADLAEVRLRVVRWATGRL